MPRLTKSSSQVYDVIVLGEGVIAATLAWKLGTDGFRVCLCGERLESLRSFRSEHFPQQAVTLYRELGLFQELKPLLSPLDYTAHFRNGRLGEITSDEDYAISYERLVATLFHGLETVATLCREPVVRVSPQGRVKSVRLQSGAVICGWVVAVASDGPPALEALPGLEEEVISKDHSLSFAWNMELAQPERMSHPALVFQSSRVRHGYDHLRLFQHQARLRGNFFTYWDAGEERGLKFVNGGAKEVLAGTVEGLFEYLGDFRMTSPLEVAQVSLTRVRGAGEAGVVLLGNACGQTAPIFELGLCQGLHDVKILASLTSGWLRERQITPEILGTYYEHPAKKTFDAEALSKGLSARNAATDRGPEWLARRLNSMPEWLETACLRGVEGGRWTLENLGMPAWRKGRQLVQTYRESRAKTRTGPGSGGLLAPSHDDLSRADGLDDLVS